MRLNKERVFRVYDINDNTNYGKSTGKMPLEVAFDAANKIMKKYYMNSIDFSLVKITMPKKNSSTFSAKKE